jgi:hypothetical protein
VTSPGWKLSVPLRVDVVLAGQRVDRSRVAKSTADECHWPPRPRYAAQPHDELRRALLLVDHDVVDKEAWRIDHRVVVDQRDRHRGRFDGGVGGVSQREKEQLGCFGFAVVAQLHAHRLDGFAGLEGQRAGGVDVVVAAGSGIAGVVDDRDRQCRWRVQLHRDVDETAALADRDRSRRNARLRAAGAVRQRDLRQRRAARDAGVDRVVQQQLETLGEFGRAVIEQRNGHRLDTLAGCESQHAAGGRVILAGDGAAVTRGVSNADRSIGGFTLPVAQPHDEQRLPLLLIDDDVVDEHPRQSHHGVVVDDGHGGRSGGDAGAGGVAQREEEDLGRLGVGVVAQLHPHGLGQLTRLEGQRSRGVDVVVAAGGGVGGVVGHRDRAGSRRVQAHDDIGEPVAFADGDGVDEQAGHRCPP